MTAVRVWPAADYTRVTIEHREPLKFTHFMIKDPERLVVDLEGIEFTAVLERFLAEFATINSFTECHFETPLEGNLVKWPPRIGRQHNI